MAQTLPSLEYGYDALEPYIDAETMRIHHTKHHQAYVDKLNQVLTDYPEGANESVENLLRNLANLPESVRTGIRNAGGGHYNHSLFWKIMKPSLPADRKDGKDRPTGELGEMIKRDFGDFNQFQEAFSKAGETLFGSGWAWLTYTKGKKLTILQSTNQDNPISDKLGEPIMGLDVWEHAYYLKYQNRRAEYIEQWWQVINWEQVKSYLKAAKSKI